jgi:hypothetical protein
MRDSYDETEGGRQAGLRSRAGIAAPISGCLPKPRTFRSLRTADIDKSASCS